MKIARSWIALILLLTTLPAGAGTALVLGDSLSAAYNLPAEDGWVALLERRLAPEHRIVNASVSGETTRGGLARLDRLLADHQPDVLVVELGANDGLRGLPLSNMESALAEIVQRGQQAGARVLILGMRLPPNYGSAYADRFHQVYRRVAEKTGAELIPFFLAEIATRWDLMQPDGVHPTAEAQPALADRVEPALRSLLEPDTRETAE